VRVGVREEGGSCQFGPYRYELESGSLVTKTYLAHWGDFFARGTSAGTQS